MQRLNNVLFAIEFDNTEHPNVYWGNKVPNIEEAKEFLRRIGHESLVGEYNRITDVFEIVNLEQAKGLWDMSKINLLPHYNG